MKAHVILETVAKTLTQRGTANGYDKQEERSAAEVARILNAKYGDNKTAESVWKMLIALKEARLNRQLANGSDPTDTLIDLIGYTALLAECLTEKA
ncbi:hypothetical protein [Hafnia phage TS33]|nr:hypothetical protein [Hafnia phage TS33]